MISEQGWYVADNGETKGPMSRSELLSALPGLQGPDTMVYGPEAPSWTPAKTVAGLLPAGAVVPSAPPPPPSTGTRSDEIDYQIFGDDMQFVEVTLDPNEMVIAEAGNMMFMTQGIRMETTMGDPTKQGQGLMNKLMDAGKRALTGESIFLTTFTASGSAQDKVAFAGAYPGKIIPMHLDEIGGELLCQKDSFLAAARGTDVGIAFQKKIGAGLFGGEGFILQRLRGDGIAFIHAGGCVHEIELQASEVLKLDTGCLVAFQPGVDYDIEMAGGIKNAVFGGEGLFLATLRGPGKIWVQSLPFSRLAGRMASSFSSDKGEGSVIGGLSRMFEQ